MHLRSLVLLALAGLVGCAGGRPRMELASPSFRPGETVPVRHTCDGEDVSPALRWGPAPEGTKSLALICDDPDAPRGDWVHWVVYGLPPDLEGLAEGSLPPGTLQGVNDFGRTRYNGPCPPPGAPHRYSFRLYALDRVPDLPAGATKARLLQAMEGHVLARAELVGRYGRKRP